ncbi:MAG: zinc ribbon domain-containing protein [Anaerofustis stercorihominis]|nr:zinc ribbon domain-containing protein [Anaerofustis stercorihominis]
MSFLKRMIKKGIGEGIEKAVGEAVSKVVEPKATELANKAAKHIEEASKPAVAETKKTFSGLEEAFSNLERAAQGYATEAAKNIKICPECGKPANAEVKFCQDCGAKLPEKTVAEGAVCPKCGKQNAIGTKFCQDCGEKLPQAIEEENAQMQRDNDVLTKEWAEYLPEYPVWDQGGNRFNIEQYDTEIFSFTACFDGSYVDAKEAVRQYRETLKSAGFTQAGQYPSEEHLYKMVGEKCYHADTEHCFESNSDCPAIGFSVGEPTGGFNYVKPEPKKKTSILDLFK